MFLPIAAADIANEFAQILHRTLGIDLDATVGFLTNRQRTEERREQPSFTGDFNRARASCDRGRVAVARLHLWRWRSGAVVNAPTPCWDHWRLPVADSA